MKISVGLNLDEGRCLPLIFTFGDHDKGRVGEGRFVSLCVEIFSAITTEDGLFFDGLGAIRAFLCRFEMILDGFNNGRFRFEGGGAVFAYGAAVRAPKFVPEEGDKDESWEDVATEHYERYELRQVVVSQPGLHFSAVIAGVTMSLCFCHWMCPLLLVPKLFDTRYLPGDVLIAFFSWEHSGGGQCPCFITFKRSR